MQKQLVPFVVAVLSVIAAVVRVEAHAFLVRAEPRVGSKLDKAPTQVRIWFSESVDPASSSIKVFDGQGKQVDKKDTHSDRANRDVLCVSLIPALTRGSYKVVWRVTSIDTHVTDGDFHFQIQDRKDTTRDLLLNSENISHLAIEPLRPKVVTVTGIDQLNIDSPSPSDKK